MSATTKSDRASALGVSLDDRQVSRGAAHLAWHMIELMRERANSPNYTVTDSIIAILQQNDTDLIKTGEDAFTRSCDRITGAKNQLERMQVRQENQLLDDATKLFALPERSRSTALRQAVVAYLPISSSKILMQ